MAEDVLDVAALLAPIGGDGAGPDLRARSDGGLPQSPEQRRPVDRQPLAARAGPVVGDVEHPAARDRKSVV